MITYCASYYIALPGSPVAGEYRTTSGSAATAALVAILAAAAESTSGAENADTSATITQARTPTDTTVTDHYTGPLFDVLTDLQAEIALDQPRPSAPFWRSH